MLKYGIIALLILSACTSQTTSLEPLTGKAVVDIQEDTTTTTTSTLPPTTITLSCPYGKARLYKEDGSIQEVCRTEKYIRECSKDADCGAKEVCDVNEFCRPL